MFESKTWFLPEGINELVPTSARQIEYYRRMLIDNFNRWGYDLVMPPMVDFLDSLLTGTGRELAQHTFTLTDQVSGRLLGVRADMTPQIARMDARMSQVGQASRLCYIGTILNTQVNPYLGSRSPMQIGAELFGRSDNAADIEIISLMLDSLQLLDVRELHLDLGHVGLFRSLCLAANLTEEQEWQLHLAVHNKACTDIQQLILEMEIASPYAEQITALSSFNGDISVLTEAGEFFKDADASIAVIIKQLSVIAMQLQKQYPEVSIFIDLAELRGYSYHTGTVFATYAPGLGQEIAGGGRYDNIGAVFGKARPATGFSSDLKVLLEFANKQQVPETNQVLGILAPTIMDADLLTEIKALRAAGHRVICSETVDQSTAQSLFCDRILTKQDQDWQVSTLAEKKA